MAVVRRTRKKDKAPPTKSRIEKAEFDITKKKEVGVSDLTLLSKISDDAINDNLHKRFMNNTIYTYIGHVLISVNPFQDLGIYTQDNLNKYKGKNRLEVPPHVFAIAETMYYNLKSYGENQCVIISGESGAGKTEAAKQIMQYIANVSVDDNDAINTEITKIKDMVLATNPLLESFGCAKTLRNNNSSRHGKYLEIYFNPSNYQPIAAHITNYLLEKQRVVSQITNERNFHIFYQFTKHCPPEYQQKYGIQGPETYIYTSAAGCVSVDGVNDSKDFSDTLNAMKIIGLSAEEQDLIFRMLASILWIGNISFVEDEQGNAAIRDESVTNFVAYLLESDANLVRTAITEKIVQTSHGARRGSTYHSPLNIVQATAVRDALAKGIYNNLFEWIVERVNQSLKGTSEQFEKKSIGILDIYGFEIFELNSFEQICINYVNEKLQQIFIQLTLKAEQDEYVQEQIKWTPIDYFNNKVVCDLIEATRPPGLFSALNDSVKTAHADSDAADQVFAQRLAMVGSTNRHFEDRKGKFIIKHYAGDVTYEVSGMTDKNKDAMLRDLLELLATSKNSFITSVLFPSHLLTSLLDSRKRSETASDKIKKSANLLVDTLSQCQPSYIRTIKPNQTKRPKEYDNHQVLHQIKYLGLKENVRIRRAGFAYRTTFEKFVKRFYLLSANTGYAGDYIWQGDDISAVREILKACYIPESEFQMGTTKVFIKTPETLFALEDMRDKYWHNMAARIQRAWRRYLKRKEDAAIVMQRAWRNKTHGNKYEQFRDYGNSLLHGRKQRRRFSMLGSRAFMGDYLGCNDSTGYGKYVMGQAGINEHVIFSCKGEILLSKFGRSSKRLGRIFIMTKNSFYVVAEQLVDRKLLIQKEFTLPIGGLNYVGLSTFQDNWIALSLHSPTPTTPDIFINLDFKTELVAHLKKANPGLTIKIDSTVQYQKKPGKYHTVKFVIGNAPKNSDTYKSGTVTVDTGLPGNSTNPKRPRGNSGKVDYSKYRNRGGMNGSARSYQAPAQTYQAPAQSYQAPAQYQPAQARTVPPAPAHKNASASQSAAPPAVAAAQAALHTGPTVPAKTRKPAPPPVANKPAKKAAPPPQPAASQQPARKTAPPPPPPPPALSAVKTPKYPTYKVNFDYDGSVAGSIPLKKDSVVYVASENGQWGLVKDLEETKEGWAPLSFMEKCDPPADIFGGKSGPPPPPPAPASLTTTAAQTPSSNGHAASTAATSDGIGNGLAAALQAKKQEESTLAGSIADALKKRQVTRDSDDEDEDDDDDW